MGENGRFWAAMRSSAWSTSASGAERTGRTSSMSSKEPTSNFGSTSSFTVKARSPADLDRLLHALVAAVDVDGRLVGEAQAVVLDDLAVRLVDGVLQHVAHDRLAIHLAQMIARHLARAEAVDADLVLHRVEFALEPLGEVLHRQNHLVGALEAFGEGFSDLHLALPSSNPAAIAGRARALA